MRFNNLILAAAAFTVCFQGTPGLAASVETISDYAKIASNAGRNANEAVNRNLTREKETENSNEANEIDYEDFDDVQERSKLLNQQSTSNDLVKYFSGLISLFALLYRFNENDKGYPPNKTPDSLLSASTEPRNSVADESPNVLKKTGIPREERQDRFDFPRKKFKNVENVLSTAVNADQQLQPLENYPPYNPLTANAAETYGNSDKKTSYDVYVGQASLPGGNADNKESQFTYQATKPLRQSLNNHLADDGYTWNTDSNQPVYQSWMSNPQYGDQASNLDSYHTINSHQSWQDTKASENDDYKSNRPWAQNSVPDYSLHDHDFVDHRHPDDYRQDHSVPYHEVEHHAVDEDRVSKKPYSYYFLGRKLWYVPLLFSVYFIMYVGALVLKSVARHKIQFPEKVWDLHEDVYGHGKRRTMRKIDEITENYENAVANVKNKFM